jgi:RimJ/RimL family protein N-acetyltransferase
MSGAMTGQPGPATLETPRLLLRPFTLDDAEPFLRMNSEPEIIRYTYQEALSSLEAAIDLMHRSPLKDYATWGYGRLAVVLKESGEVIGFCGLKYLPEIGETEVGYRLMPEHWQQGLATEAAARAVEHGKKDLGLQRIVALVDPGNAASARVAEKIGLRLEGQVPFPGIKTPLDLYAWEEGGDAAAAV